jgi:tetratricopeptide (TPR) repeat protein
MVFGEAEMNLKILALTAAGAVTLLPAVKAFAYDSVLPLSPDPMQQCSDYAARAGAGEVVAKWSLKTCDQAVDRAKGLRDELAAAYVNRSVIHLALAQYDAALADSDAAIRVKADIVQAHLNRGIALSAEKHNKEAGQAFTDALALNPSHPEIVYFDRAMAREDDGDMKGAYLDYRKAAQLAPTWDTPKQQLARFTVAGSPNT